MAERLGRLPVVRLRRLNAAETRGPPRSTLMITAGKSDPAMYENPSDFSEMPGDEDDVIARTPALDAPSTILMAAISDSACKKVPPTLGICFGHVGGKFGLRGNRVTKKAFAAGAIAATPSASLPFIKMRSNVCSPFGYRSTRITQSGQMVAHIAQEMHAS